MPEDEVQRRPVRDPLFLNKIKYLVRNVKELPSDDLALEASKRFKASEHTPSFQSDSSDINPEHKPWQYRSDIDDIPTNVRTYKIYNTRGSLAVNTQGQVYSTSKDAESMYIVHRNERVGETG